MHLRSVAYFFRATDRQIAASIACIGLHQHSACSDTVPKCVQKFLDKNDNLTTLIPLENAVVRLAYQATLYQAGRPLAESSQSPLLDHPTVCCSSLCLWRLLMLSRHCPRRLQMDYSHRLSSEVWQNGGPKSRQRIYSLMDVSVFLHFDSSLQTDREAIFNCLLVSRQFYMSMDGRPLFNDIRIKQTRQIPQLLCCVTKKVVRAQHIKMLVFDIDRNDWSDGSEVGARRLTEDLAAITYLLNLASGIQSLWHVPLLSTQYASVLEAIVRMPNLKALALAIFRPAATGELIRQISLEDSFRLIQALTEYGSLTLSNFDASTLPTVLYAHVSQQRHA